MAETLGEAVLVLRTDDRGIDRGVGEAEGKARQLQGTFDRTSGSATRLSGELQRTGQAAGSAATQFQRVGSAVTVAAGQQRFGLMDLSRQIGDISTMYALGARPAMIFASQIGQITQSLQLAAGGTSKFAAFLGRPWGIALAIAVQAIGPLVGLLWENEKAAQAAELANSGLSDAQSVLGQMFDLTTGKIRAQNEQLRLNAQLTAANLRAEASAARVRATSAAAGAQFGTVETILAYLGRRGGAVGGARAAGDKVSGVIRGVLGGSIPADQARARVSRGELGALGISQQDFDAAIRDALEARLKDETAGGIERTLNSNRLDPMFRREGRAKRPPRQRRGPKDRTAEIANQQAAAIAQLSREELQAKLDLATDADERATIQQELLALDRAERVRSIEASTELSRAQKDAQLAIVARLYGTDRTQGPDGEIVVEPNQSLQAQRLRREQRQQEMTLANDGLSRQAAALGAQAAITLSLRERNALERRALALQQEIERNLLEQDIANGRVAQADLARAQLAEQQAAVRQGQLREQQSPLEAYRTQLQASAANIDNAIEEIQVRGLEQLNDQLVEAILNAENLGDVFSSVAKQIIADLLRIAIQQSIIAPLAGLLGLGGGGGIFSTIGKAIGFGGGKALGGPISGGTAYLVGERGPELIVPRSDGMVIPNGALTGGGGGRGGAGPYFDLRGAVMTEDLLRQMNAIASATAQSAIGGYDRIVGDRVREHVARRG